MTQTHFGEMMALATALCWTVSSVAFEHASRRAGSLPVNFIRLAIAFCGLCAIGLLGNRGMLLPLDAPRDAWFWLSLSGVVGFFVGDLALFRAFVLMGARLATLLQCLAPPMAAVIGAVFLGEKIAPVGWLGMSITLAGIVWVISERTKPATADQKFGGLAARVSPQAVGLGLVAALGQAAGLVMGKAGIRDYPHPFAATQIRAIAGILGFALLILALRDVKRLGAALRNRAAMFQLSIGAVAGPLLGVSLLLMSLQYGVLTGVAQTLTALVPVLILPYAIFVKRERVSWRAIVGAVVAVAGVAVLVLKG